MIASGARALASAWHGVRGRGWRAGLMVGLLGCALAAATVVFSAADSFALTRLPYPEASRLMVIQRDTTMSGPSASLPPPVLRGWRAHSDLFAAVHAHERDASLYLTLGGITEPVRTERVTPGLFDALGVRPRWGRTLVESDAAPDAPPVAVIREDLAIAAFGTAPAALGALLGTGEDQATVVGVMPHSFRFPSAADRIWKPLDLDRAAENRYLAALFLRAANRSDAEVAQAVLDRGPALARLSRFPMKGADRAVRLADVGENPRHRTAVMLLLGAAICLLLIACANIASLEIAAARQRARSYAIHSALGAPRGSLLAVALIEGAILLVASLVVAAGLARWGVEALTASLPPSMRDPLTNPMDLDERALVFLASAAAAAWFLAALPTALRATRIDILEVLQRGSRGVRTDTGVALRHVLMAGQVAATVVLLVGAALCLRTYAAHLSREKGFDSTNLAALELFAAPGTPRAMQGEVERELLSRLTSHPAVRGISRADLVPPSASAGIGFRLSVRGRPDTTEMIQFVANGVDPEYLETMRIRLVAGRWLQRGDKPGTTVIDERFARRYWPAGDPIGARFRLGSTMANGASEFEVVGVASDVRMDQEVTAGGQEKFMGYMPLAPNYHPLSFVVRLETSKGVGALASLAREIAPGAVVRAALVDERYARLFGDVRLAAYVTAGFGALALFVATAGVYGLMTFVVTLRTREIGVRMALGAEPRDIRRMFFRSSGLGVGAGLIAGAAGAAVVLRSFETLFVGVSSADPATLLAVSGVVIAAAALATWRPASRAARVDPAITLRAE